MTVKRFLVYAVGTVSLMYLFGIWSGSQVDRDAVAAAEAEFGVSFEQQAVVLDEVTLNVVFVGPADGLPVILLHGYPEFWYSWRGVAAELGARGYRVIVPDQRGYNLSDKPASVDAYRLDVLARDIVALKKVLGYEKVFLAGHDFGGLVAWWTLILFPEHIERAVIVNKPHPYAAKFFPAEEETISWYRTFLQIPWVPGFVARLANWRVLSENLKATSNAGTFSDGVLDQYRTAWDREGAIHTMGKWYRANADFELEVDDIRISVPTQLLIAADDAFSALDLQMKTEEFLLDGEVVPLGVGTHWVIQEEPALIAGRLASFFLISAE